VRAFADRLVRLLSDEARRRTMGAAARVHVDATFSLERTGAAFLEAYDELLANDAHAPLETLRPAVT
jgi:glycosyltransferase involved in cell wall biosynthesis